MSNIKYKSAGVSVENIDKLTVPISSNLISMAVIIGTARTGPAFIPVKLKSIDEFQETFGASNITGSLNTAQSRLTSYGSLAAEEFLKNSSQLIFMRVLGAGDGKKRLTSGDVTNAGFTVGEKQPDHSNFSGSLSLNPFANSGGPLGRTYFLGCFMSESLDSTFFSSAGLQGKNNVNSLENKSVPIVRGIIMAPSGVILRLSSSGGGYNSSAPSDTQVASDLTSKGTTLGSIKLFDAYTGNSLQQFVLLLNGHIGTKKYPNVITASLDIQSKNYITKTLNTDPLLIQNAGHCLYSYWDIHPSTAVLTGSGVVSAGADLPTDSNRSYSTERSVFLLTSSLSRDTGSSTVPNYESFRDRFTHASTPWVISQKFNGKPINLFKLHALDAGSSVASRYKFIVDNVSPALEDYYEYGSFDLTIRNSDDFSETISPIEKHTNLSLDPKSNRYICKVIGDRHTYFDFDRPEDSQKFVVEGNYPLRSRLVRVEVSSEVSEATVPKESLPFGFRGMQHIITSGSSPMSQLGASDLSALTKTDILQHTITPPIPYSENIIFYTSDVDYIASTVRRWGIKTDHPISVEKQNQISQFNFSIFGFVTHYPKHSTSNINFVFQKTRVAQDTTQLGIIDSDRFCNNLFSLENIQVVTGSNNKITWTSAKYIREGNVNTNVDLKTRGIIFDDFKSMINKPYLSFQFMLQGGFGGVNIFEKNEYNISNIAAQADMFDSNRGKLNGSTISSYLTALKIISDTTLLDMSILSIPGIRIPEITDRAIQIVEERYDSLYIMDIEQVDNNGNLIDISKIQTYDQSLIPSVQKTIDRFNSRDINSSFVSTYFPDVVMELDIGINGISSVEVPPSVVVLGTLALNDSIGNPWFSLAGPSQGSLQSTLETVVKLNELDLDNLYSNKINPLYASKNVSGQGTGVVIWGQKTLLSGVNAMTRMSTRRLLLEIRRIARQIAHTLLFENDVNSIISNFNSRMLKALSSIKSSFGLENYNVNVNVSQTTNTDIQNNIIRGKIYIQPKGSKEFISTDLIVSNKPSFEA